MNLLVRMVLIVGLALPLVLSCDDSPTSTRQVPKNGFVFPQEVGVLWTYEVYDSLTSLTDTVQVSITNSMVSDSGQNMVVVKYHYFADSVLIRSLGLSGDTLIWYDYTLNAIRLEYFVFPLNLGSFWTGPMGSLDTSRVTDSGAITVPAGNFPVGMRVERTWNVGFEGDSSFSSTWLVPDVGIVSRYLYTTSSDGTSVTVTTNQTWKLLSYNLATFGIDEFPNQVGSMWMYQTYDSTSRQYDTLYVSILDTLRVQNDPATLWEYRYRDSVDSQYVAVGDNEITVFPTNIPWQSWYYKFPLAVGRNWGLVFVKPPPRIIAKDSVTVAAGTFEKGFRYVYSDGAFNSYWSTDDWLVPGVGLVSRTWGEANLGPLTYTTWELLSYRIPPDK